VVRRREEAPKVGDSIVQRGRTDLVDTDPVNDMEDEWNGS